MRRTRRYALLGAGAACSALVVTAVHTLASLPLPVALYVDGVVGVCWLVAAVLLLDCVGEPEAVRGEVPGPRRHSAVRYSTDSDPVARSHWSRHGR
ncbi:hypothetical protein AB0O07_06090 [Streptomyces sp. NPDC093085]|uniref:hypothetical protein n=1 Tax=Streptomyces sp. NPDC093085 TaxID=3155068 RepID=UPI00343F1F7D